MHFSSYSESKGLQIYINRVLFITLLTALSMVFKNLTEVK